MSECKKIELMHKLFGIDEQHKCAECDHLVRHVANRSYFKCEVYGDTASEATDWRLKYTACGFFNKPYDWIPVIEYKKHMPKSKEYIQCEGQMTLEGI